MQKSSKNFRKTSVLVLVLLFSGFVLSLSSTPFLFVPTVFASSGKAMNSTWAYQMQNQQNTGYSPQNLINASNVGLLHQIWSTRLPSLAGTPVVVNGIIYVSGQVGCTKFTCNGDIFAVNETTGKSIWTDGAGNSTFNLQSIQFRVRAGVTIDHGNVFAGTWNNSVVSMNASTGAENWIATIAKNLTGNAIPYLGAEATPLVYNGEVILGETAGDGGPASRGVIQAFNETNGAHIWTFYTMPPSPINSTNQVGYQNSKGQNTWGTNGTSGDVIGGGAVWNVPAVDPKTGIIYFGTGNPSNIQTPLIGAPDSTYTQLYTDSVVALNSTSGKMVWYYQVVHTPYIDWDNGMPVQLFNTTISGVNTEVVGDGGKSGFYVALNAANGSLIWRTPVGIHLHDNVPVGNLTTNPTLIYPGDNGGVNTFSSFDPTTNMVYTIASNHPNSCT